MVILFLSEPEEGIGSDRPGLATAAARRGSGVGGPDGLQSESEFRFQLHYTERSSVCQPGGRDFRGTQLAGNQGGRRTQRRRGAPPAGRRPAQPGSHPRGGRGAVRGRGDRGPHRRHRRKSRGGRGDALPAFPHQGTALPRPSCSSVSRRSPSTPGSWPTPPTRPQPSSASSAHRGGRRGQAGPAGGRDGRRRGVRRRRG